MKKTTFLAGIALALSITSASAQTYNEAANTPDQKGWVKAIPSYSSPIISTSIGTPDDIDYRPAAPKWIQSIWKKTIPAGDNYNKMQFLDYQVFAPDKNTRLIAYIAGDNNECRTDDDHAMDNGPMACKLNYIIVSSDGHITNGKPVSACYYTTRLPDGTNPNDKSAIANAQKTIGDFMQYDYDTGTLSTKSVGLSGQVASCNASVKTR